MVTPGHAEGPADADAYVVSGSLTTTNSALSLGLTNAQYTLDPPTACVHEPVPQPVNTDVPGFVDASRQEAGRCPGVSGGGMLTLAACTTGLMTADWQLTEPTSQTTATFNGTGVVIGGVTLLAAPPAAGYGYSDDGATGAGLMVGVLVLPLSGGGVSCPTSQLDVTALVGAAY